MNAALDLTRCECIVWIAVSDELPDAGTEVLVCKIFIHLCEFVKH